MSKENFKSDICKLDMFLVENVTETCADKLDKSFW